MNAALDAAMTTVPRLLIEACITIFANANTPLCSPAGSPILIILLIVPVSIRSLFGSSLIYSSSFRSLQKRIIELIAFDMTVAIATPSTDSLRTITKNRFRITFIIPDSKRAISGALVLPMLLNIAASKL